MRHAKSRFSEDARRVGIGAVFNRTYRIGLNAVWGRCLFIFGIKPCIPHIILYNENVDCEVTLDFH